MSKEQAIAFFREVTNNKKIAEEVNKVVKKTKDKKATATELVALAKKHGFEFSVEEAGIARDKILSSLSDEELSNVVGGVGFFSGLIGIVLSVFSSFGATFSGAASRDSQVGKSSNQVVEQMVTHSVSETNNVEQIKEGIIQAHQLMQKNAGRENAKYTDFQKFNANVNTELWKERKKATTDEQKAEITTLRKMNQKLRTDTELQFALNAPDEFNVNDFLEVWKKTVRFKENQPEIERKLAQNFKEKLSKSSKHHEREYNNFTLNYGTTKYNQNYVIIDAKDGTTNTTLDKETARALLSDLTASMNWNSGEHYTLVIGPGVSEIGDEAFMKVGATSLKDTSGRGLKATMETVVALPFNVRVFSRISSIGSNAFANNSKLVYFSLECDGGRSCESIGDRAFQNCAKLYASDNNATSINLYGVKSIGAHAFEGCEALNSVLFPQVEEIGDHAFSNCERLSFFNISDDDQGDTDYAQFDLTNVKHIGDYAFSNTSVNEISISANAKTLGEGAFSGCEYVGKIHINSSQLPESELRAAFDDDVFDKCVVK